MPIQALVSDLFGTLVDSFSRREYHAVLAEMAGQLGAPAAEFISLWDGSFRARAEGRYATRDAALLDVCGQLGVRPAEAQLAAAIAIRNAFGERTLTVLKPGALAALGRLRAAGMRTALITDCTWEVPQLWPATPLAPLFDVTVFSCAVHLRKPDPRIYALACGQLGVAAADCVYVGDGSSHELTGAAQAGMRPIQYRAPGYEDNDVHRLDEDAWQGPVATSWEQIAATILEGGMASLRGNHDTTI